MNIRRSTELNHHNSCIIFWVREWQKAGQDKGCPFHFGKGSSIHARIIIKTGVWVNYEQFSRSMSAYLRTHWKVSMTCQIQHKVNKTWTKESSAMSQDKGEINYRHSPPIESKITPWFVILCFLYPPQNRFYAWLNKLYNLWNTYSINIYSILTKYQLLRR